MVEKVVRDGMVAVIVSRGYGSGWSTVANYPSDTDVLMYHPKLVEMIESGELEELVNGNKAGDFAWWVKSVLGVDDMYLGGWSELEIQWIPQGTRFTVEEYDGAEYIVTEADLLYIA